jgi:hypothetical protein
MYKKQTQKTAGFGVIGVVVVAVALVGLVAWRFYDASKGKAASRTLSTSGSQANKPQPIVDPYAGWQSATLKYEKATFTVRPEVLRAILWISVAWREIKLWHGLRLRMLRLPF